MYKSMKNMDLRKRIIYLISGISFVSVIILFILSIVLEQPIIIVLAVLVGGGTIFLNMGNE